MVQTVSEKGFHEHWCLCNESNLLISRTECLQLDFLNLSTTNRIERLFLAGRQSLSRAVGHVDFR